MRTKLRLSVCIYGGYVGLAILKGATPWVVARRQLRDAENQDEAVGLIVAAAQTFGSAYSVRTFIVDRPGPVAKRLRGRGITVKIMPLAAARQILGQMTTIQTNRELYDHVLSTCPELTRFVTILRTGRLAVTQRWRLVPLRAVALGLAAALQDDPTQDNN